jgi:hypothetical protein
LTKELKIYNGEIAASSTKTVGKTGLAVCKKPETRSMFITLYQY